jgi:amino acid adenylation domain-containing protein
MTDLTPFPTAFADRARDRPHALAVIGPGGPATYRQLFDQASAVAAAVTEAGGGPNRIVGLSCPRGVDGLVGMLGIWLSGSALLYLDPGWPAERRRQVLAQCAPPVVLNGGFAAGGRRPVIPLARPTDLAYVVYTSGSTGTPKAVAVEHGGVANMTKRLAEVFMVHGGVRVLQFAAWTWDAAMCEILVTLAAGGTLVIAPDNIRADVDRIAAYVHGTHVNVATLPPSLLAALPATGLPDLRTVVSVGEDCPPAVVERWAPGRTFLNGYGPSEAAVAVSVGRCRPGEPVTVGHPLPGVKVRIVGDGSAHLGLPVATGAVGELWVGGVGVARGYLRLEPGPDGRPAVDTGRGPFQVEMDGSRWYRTGDLVRELPDGRLVFVGRLDDEIELHGHRIQPGEVEAALRTHPAVRACAVVKAGGRLVASVVADPGVSGEALAEHAAARLPAHMVPAVRLVDQIPTTEAGKVNRSALRGAEVLAPDPPVGDITAAVLAQVRAVLGPMWSALGADPDLIGPDTDFFDAGGHSLLAAQLAVALTEHLGVPVQARQVVENLTAARLAKVLDRANAAAARTTG